jgi:GntR family transcriptional regulator/MocR family aminotransferase
MHLILRLAVTGVRTATLVARMRQDGLYAEALTDWTASAARAPRPCLLNFTNIDPGRPPRGFGRRILTADVMPRQPAPRTGIMA